MNSITHWLGGIPLPDMEGNSRILQFIGKWGYHIYEEREVMQMYLHLILASLFPIYIGSHASIRCPPSATDPAKEKTATTTTEDDDDDELEDTVSPVEGLTPSDAIMFPVFASIVLAGLYFLIKWLNNTALLNKILGYYFSLIGIFGVGKLAGDALNVGTTFLFPSVWSRGIDIYHVDQQSQKFTNEPTVRERESKTIRRIYVEKRSPLPGSLSRMMFSDSINEQIWAVRALYTDHWIFRGYIHGFMKVKSRVRLNDVVGFLVGVVAIGLYNTSGKLWWLGNLMGFGFCYGTLQLMSPTTFWTGSLVLGGLFIYDIIMVFYTPLMVTVATSLDVPIKLVFPGPKRGGMLGLGDIVLPGIMMALALRFDLYLHYLRKQSPPAKSKPTYITATGKWGDRFWTSSVPSTLLPSTVAGAVFPKVYFHASIVGYIIGMLTTLTVLSIFHHAQPALLYLVPGVLGSLWGTALVRGELKLMWNYTEAEETDEAEERKKDGMALDAADKKAALIDIKDKGSEADKKDGPARTEAGGKKEKDREKVNEHALHVFLFSLSAPRKKAKVAE